MLKSSWIRRLNPRDEREHVQGSCGETDNQNPRVAPCESLCTLAQVAELMPAEGVQVSVDEVSDLKKNSQVAGSLQDKASSKPDASDGVREKSNSKNDITPDASIQVFNKQNDDSADRQSKRLSTGSEGVATQLRERRSGFGPWVNVCSGSRIAEKPQIPAEIEESSSKQGVNGFARRTFSNSPGAFQPPNGMSRSGAQAATIPPVNMGKPPLPPARSSGTSGRSKLGLLPRPISQSPDFLPFLPGIAAPSPSSKSIPIPDRETPHSSLLGHPLQTSVNREGTPIRGTCARAGVSFMVSKPSKQACPDGNKAAVNGVENGAHPSVITAARIDHHGTVSENHESVLVGKAVDFLSRSSQQAGLYSPPKSGHSAAMPPPSSVLRIAKPWKVDKRVSSEGMDSPVKGVGSVKAAKDATSVNLSSKVGVTDVSRHENDGPEFDKSGEAASQIAIRQLKGNSLEPSPSLRVALVDLSESSHGTANIDKADGVVVEPACSASSTANYPWEMFVEAAGLSRKARDQFVDMYNRARAELKNQRTTHMASRASGKEMDDAAHKPERQPLEGQQQLMGYLQSQGKLTATSGISEHKVSFSGVDAKALSIHAVEQERSISGQQVACLPAGYSQAVHQKKVQTLWATHGADGRAGPLSKPGHCSNTPALSANSALNTLNRSPGDNLCVLSNPAVSQGTDGFEKDHLLPSESQSHVSLSKTPPERENHQNKYGIRNLDSRPDAVTHITCKVQGIEDNVHSQSQGFLRCTPAMKDKHPEVCLKPLSKGLSQVAVKSDHVRVREHPAAQLLGKRPRGVSDDGAATSAGIAGKRSADGTERSLGGPHVWLQRWHPTYHNTKSMQGHQYSESNGVKQDSLGAFSLSMVKSKNSDGCMLHDKTTERSASFSQNVSFEKDRGYEYIPSHSEKLLPSAAAMAIVGTAARQFCSAQPGRKGYFAFWSGFGMPTVPKPDIQKGKGKL